MKLNEALEATPWRKLKVIGRQRGLHFSSNIHKADLVSRLSQHLLDPDSLRQTVSNLSTDAQQALAGLLMAGGRLLLCHLRPNSDHQPPFVPSTPAERNSTPPAVTRLLQLGLVFTDPANDDVFIPTDVIPFLPKPELPRPPPHRPQSQPFAPVDQLCHDLTILLALLQRDEIIPLHRRWLPPDFLSNWGQLCRVSRQTPDARSELQTGRRRFLHYLAESAGFVTSHSSFVTRPISPHSAEQKGQMTKVKEPMTITPIAWLWLRSTRPERIKSLWHAWLTPSPKRWRRFRLPGANWLTDPAVLLVPLHQALTQIDLANPAIFAQTFLKLQPYQQDLVPSNLIEPDKLLTKTIIELLTGPLVWLGVLQKVEGRQQKVERDQPSALSLHPLGLALLHQQPFDDTPPAAKFAVQSHIRPDPLDSALTLTLSGGLPDPADLMTVIELGVPSSEVKVERDILPDSSHSLPLFTASPFTIHPVSFIKALHRGWSPPALLAALNRLAERPLTGQEIALLQSWAKAAVKMTIGPAMLLETQDPGVINRLASTRRGRAFIKRTLSPRAVVVDPAKLPQMVRRLTGQESTPPRLTIDNEQLTTSNSPIQNSKLEVQNPLNSAASHLWLAVQVYQSLGQLSPLPVHIPQALNDKLAAAITGADQAAAEIVVKQILADLQRLITGQAPFPPWPDPNLSVEKRVTAIEEALAQGKALRLSYYTAGRDELTQRCVEPYRLEWRGPIPYLVGFCRKVQRDRLFRLDRIKAFELVDDEDCREA